MRPLCRLCVNVSQFQLGVVFLGHQRDDLERFVDDLVL